MVTTAAAKTEQAFPYRIIRGSHGRNEADGWHLYKQGDHILLTRKEASSLLFQGRIAAIEGEPGVDAPRPLPVPAGSNPWGSILTGDEDDILVLIVGITDEGQLRSLLASEVANQNRPLVVQAAESRLADLTSA